MAWRMKSLSEDNIDVYTHTWTVVFFLFISFLVLVIPQRSTHQGSSTTRTANLPKYEASCWCPAQFEPSQVAYANSVCATLFKFDLERRNHSPASKSIDLPWHGGGSNIWTEHENTMDLAQGDDKTNKERHQNQKRLMTIPVASVLFLMGVCLRIPRMLWSILSGCTSCINMDQTLKTAKAGDSMDDEKRHQLYSTLIKTFSDSSKRHPNISTYVYILMKCMVIVVIVGEIVVVTQHSLVKTQDAGNNTLVETKPWYGTYVTADSQFHTDSDDVYHCFFRIRQMENVHDYTLQCLMKRLQSDAKLMNDLTLPGIAQEAPGSMLFNIHLMVISVLGVLAVLNVFNTACLLVNLCSTSNRQSMGLRRTSPLDQVLLIHMARLNLGVTQATGLAEVAAVIPESGKGEQLIV